MEQLFHFLSQLEGNNNREWFHLNKSLYDNARKTYEVFVGKVIEGISTFDPDITGIQVKDCVFRIYRDTRFSHDKIPYKTHMGAFIAKGGKMNPRGGYYVHCEPGNSLFSGGIWCPDAALLKALRQDIYDNADELSTIVEDPEFNRWYAMDNEKLKKVPAPFPADFRYADWLKFKRFTPVCMVPDNFFFSKDAVDKTVERLRLLLPLNRFLNYTVDETLKR